MAGTVRIGTSGWVYPPWRGVFYPKGVTQKRELAYLASLLDSVEINGSFYSLQRPSSYESWRDQTPDDFVFAVKGSRFITHMKRLRDAEAAMANFFASGLLALGPKLGPLLWQLPATFPYERDVIEDFLKALPRSTAEAARLAAKHDHRVDGRAHTTTDEDRPLRHAVEPRNPGFTSPEFTDLMRAYGTAIVVADAAGDWPNIEEITTDFVYIRLHGDEELYTSGYTDAALDRWAAKIRRWLRHGDVYAYFDNDAKVRAPVDAQALKARLTPPA
ncbi:DUF72 domain-containing protein [Actinokineospora fastidiosa]|uniref:DUF72 domain-containing protein n=1 Tax=Actinokineospora fastidiosa TaxID=1816 RepID=UPI001E3D05F0|nr:DUF72 domain-containing protein [Actinokineospora fastidiosa]